MQCLWLWCIPSHVRMLQCHICISNWPEIYGSGCFCSDPYCLLTLPILKLPLPPDGLKGCLLLGFHLCSWINPFILVLVFSVSGIYVCCQSTPSEPWLNLLNLLWYLINYWMTSAYIPSYCGEFGADKNTWLNDKTCDINLWWSWSLFKGRGSFLSSKCY